METAKEIQETFQQEEPARFVFERLGARWKQLYEADTETTPILRLVESRFEEFVRKADFTFRPDEAGQERALADLSDGQRSLFHIALTAATLEVERDAFAKPQDTVRRCSNHYRFTGIWNICDHRSGCYCRRTYKPLETTSRARLIRQRFNRRPPRLASRAPPQLRPS
jgi:hypothetical protein